MQFFAVNRLSLGLGQGQALAMLLLFFVIFACPPLYQRSFLYFFVLNKSAGLCLHHYVAAIFIILQLLSLILLLVVSFLSFFLIFRIKSKHTRIAYILYLLEMCIFLLHLASKALEFSFKKCDCGMLSVHPSIFLHAFLTLWSYPSPGCIKIKGSDFISPTIALRGIKIEEMRQSVHKQRDSAEQYLKVFIL